MGSHMKITHSHSWWELKSNRTVQVANFKEERGKKTVQHTSALASVLDLKAVLWFLPAYSKPTTVR